MPPNFETTNVFAIVGRIIGALFGLFLIVGPLAAGYIWPWGIALGVCLIIGVAVPEIILVFFGTASYMQSPRQMQREAKERSDRLLGRDVKPVEPLSDDDIRKALDQLSRNDSR